MKQKYLLENYKLLVVDFDGVLTDNFVYVSDSGQEFVKCSRSDGIGFDALKLLDIETIILSTAKNKVVHARAEKLGVKCYFGVEAKEEMLLDLASQNLNQLSQVIYVGNDINDLKAMKISGLSICPSDANPKIKSIANIVLQTNGGNGVVREILEEIFNIDLAKIIYN